MTLVNSRTVRGRCPVCGAAHAACGPAQDTTPVDARMEVAAVGGPLKKYEVTTPSGVTTTMKLNEDDARRLGVLEEQEPDGTDETSEEQTSAKARTTRNKARTAANKDGGAGGGDD